MTGVAFSPDGKELASSCSDHSARIWRLDDTATAPSHELSAEDSLNGLAFGPKGARLAVASLQHALVWDLDVANVPVHTLETAAPNVRAVAMAPDGKTLVTASSDGGVRVLTIPDESK